MFNRVRNPAGGGREREGVANHEEGHEREEGHASERDDEQD